MKYKCIKDYWMDYDSEDNGDIPAFAFGEVYEFYEDVDTGLLVTDKDHQGSEHYMDMEEMNDTQYFELVGE